MHNSLFPKIDAKRDRIIHWQREMTARPALGPENGGIGEIEKALWLQAELKRMGLPEIRRVDAPDAQVPCGFRPNIIAKIPGKSAKTLWIIAHMDVVPPGDIRLWSSPPYELQVTDDYVYGRGVEDNQQAIVSAMLVAETLLENGVTPDLTLGLLFVSDEESGMALGLPHILDTEPDLVLQDHLALVPDMGNADGTFVEIIEKSCLWLRFTVLGQQCHTCTPDSGINSLIVAAECILALQRLYSTFNREDPRFTPAWSTFVPSKKEANVNNINTMPGKDVFYLDCRVLPSYPLEDIMAESKRLADEIAEKHRATIIMETVHSAQSVNETPVESESVQTLLRAIKNLRGVTPKTSGAAGQTEAAVLRARNLPAVVWATLEPNPHVPNERSSIKNTLNDAKVMAAMLFVEHKP